MKTFNNMQINPERLIKDEELVSLRGGDFTPGYCTCRNEAGGINCAGWVNSCSECDSKCNSCPGTVATICAG